MGSALGVSDDAPTLDSVYKLVAYDGRPVRKTSAGKAIWPGAKQVWRAADWSGDVLALAGEEPPGPGHRPLLAEVMRDGRRTDAGRRTLAQARERFESEWSAAPERLRGLREPTVHPVEVSPALRRLAQQIDAGRWEGGGEGA